MRYPTLRYGKPNQLIYFANFYPAKDRVRLLARQLRRSERSVKDWLDGKAKVPWWVPEILRLQRMEHADRMRHMNIWPDRPPLAVLKADVLVFATPKKKKPPIVIDDAALFALRQTG